jgi:hypothetical protein
MHTIIRHTVGSRLSDPIEPKLRNWTWETVHSDGHAISLPAKLSTSRRLYARSVECGKYAGVPEGNPAEANARCIVDRVSHCRQ